MTILDSLIAADSEVVARLGVDDIDAGVPTPPKFDNRPTWDNWDRRNFPDFTRWSKYGNDK